MVTAKRINISLQSDTLARLDQYAFEEHFNRSQAITALVWKANVKNTNVRGQMSIDDYIKPGKSKNLR